jgi:hypothetical protein
VTFAGADPSTARQRLHGLLHNVRTGRLSIEAFCSQFETTYNLELDKGELTPVEAVAFSKLFEQVVWYSPFSEERAKVPNYIGEDEVLAAVAEAERVLAANKPNGGGG